jgi:cell wall-associated NlpC family hydrolase
VRVRPLILTALGAFALAVPGSAIAAGGGGVAASSGTSAQSTVKSTKHKKKPRHRKTNANVNTNSGGAGIGAGATARSTPAHPIVYGWTAKIIHGVAYAPSFAPLAVQRAIWAGNQIRKKPYIYGGGHGSFIDSGYDCSGSVSYALHAAGLVSTPMDSSEFMSWGRSGRGRWITVYTNPGHAFVQIAGIRLDTSAEGDPNPPPGSGPRWRPLLGDTSGFAARHPSAF